MDSIYNYFLQNEGLYQTNEIIPKQIDKKLLPKGYVCLVLDKNLQLLAVLQTEKWSYTGRKNISTTISLSVAKNELRRKLATGGQLYQELSNEQIKNLKLANFIQIWKGDQLKVSGRISERDVKEKSISIKAFTEEILLEKNITPAQYGRVFNGMDVADFAREITLGWATDRIKSESQWSQYIYSSNIDLETEPSLVMLDKDVGGDYYTFGYIVLRFTKNNFSNFVKWDRIRWASDNEDPVSTTIQYRYGEEGNLSAWSSEIIGAYTDELGIITGATTESIIDIKINLSTNDVSVTPFIFALEAIARTEFEVEIGNIPSSTPLNIDALEADYNNCLSLLQEACKQTDTEFEIKNKKLNLDRSLGRDLTNSVKLRKGQNMNIKNLSDEDAELVNDLIALGQGDGINRLSYRTKNPASIQEYGYYPDRAEFNTSEIEELEALADSYLEKNSVPLSTFSIDAIFEEYEPDYKFGDTVKVVDPDSQTVSNVKIEEEKRSYDGSGVSVRLDLERSRKKLIDGVIGDKKIKSAKRAEFLVLFETVWQEDDRPNPFYELYPAEDLYPSDDLYPSIAEQNINLYVCLYDENHNEIFREAYRTRDLGDEQIQTTAFMTIGADIVSDVAYIGWVGGVQATSQSGTGLIIDKKEFTTEFRFIPTGKTDRKGW